MKNKLVLALSVVSLITLFNNCGQTPFGGMGFDSNDSSSSDQSSLVEENITTNPYALLSAEQVLKSFAALTEVPISSAAMNEYNARNTVLSPSNDLNQTTSPMMIAITNLAGQFCDDLLTKESALAMADRKFYSNVDFTKNVSSLTNAQYEDAVNNLSSHFWGRAPASAEDAVLMTSKNEFITALTAAEKSATSSTRNLMLFTCSAMLASFDSYTF